MRLLSQIQQGFLSSTDDEFEGVNPILLSRYYGIDGNPQRRSAGQTGAGHYDADSDVESGLEDETESNHESGISPSESSESEDNTFGELDEHLASDQQRHIRHPPIPVPGDESPFTDPELEALFFQCLHAVRAHEIVPTHYGLTPDEWEEGSYGELESIPYGRYGRSFDVKLPFVIWWQRAVEWVQGLEIMTELLMVQDNEM